MIEYQCWFCGEGVDEIDAGAVMICIQSLWRWNSGSPSEDDPLQQIYAHSECTKERMRGATMDLEPSTFGEDDRGLAVGRKHD